MRISLAFLFTLIIIYSSEASCLNGNCKNGFGTYKYKDGTWYTGTFLKNRPHGYGTLIYRDGTEYAGNFSVGKKEGQGHLKYKSGNSFKGNFKNGNISGFGTMNFSTGDVYSGYWSENQMHGSGIYRASGGWVYAGNFSKGKPDGIGSLSLTDGSVYKGFWRDGLKNGEFEYTDNKKNVQKISFRDDMYMGPVGVSLQGNIVSKPISEHKKILNNPTNNNFLEVSNSKVKNCNDNFCNSETGYMVMENEAVYYGEFKNGLPDGKGKFRFNDGRIAEGLWKAGKLIHSGNTGKAAQASYMNQPGKFTPSKTKSGETENYEKSNSQYIKNSKKTPQVFALIAGVSSYKALNSLRYTDDDAYRFYGFLKSPEGGALQDENIRLMIDESATSGNILNNLNSLANDAESEDALIIYLSGHGLDGGFVPHDFDGTGPLMQYNSLMETIRKSKAKYKLIIADACHSGSIVEGQRSAAASSLQQYYNSLAESSGGTAFLVSSALDEVSLEYGGIRQGIFSHFLIRGLKGEADKDVNGIVTLEELYSYVSINVSTYTGGKQNPVLSGRYDAKMPVASVRQ